MIHLDCARRVSAISLAAILILSAGSAAARSRAQIPVPIPKPAMLSDDIGDYDAAANKVTTVDPTFNIVAEEPVPESDTPTFVRSLRHVYCVEYARIRSGIAIYGNAKTWWNHAKGQYARGSNPLPGAVMVFAAVRKMNYGHVAVVKRIVSNREIIVDHANWGRDGDIYLNAPVIDVSANNDWSKVRVWNTRAGTMGSNVFPIKGFVSRAAWN